MLMGIDLLKALTLGNKQSREFHELLGAILWKIYYIRNQMNISNPR